MLGKAFRSSIVFRFFTIFALALSVSTILLSILISYHEYQSSRKRLAESGQNLAQFIAKMSREALIQKDTVALDAIVNDMDSEEIVYALIYDTHGTLMTSQFASLNYRFPRFTAMFAKLPKNADLSSIINTLKNDQHITEVALPITIDATRIGRIVLGMSEHISRGQIIRSVMFVVAINVLMASLLCFVLILVSRKILFNPLSALSESNLKLAQGDLSVRVNIRAQGELKLLVDSFNHMAASLDENEQQLRVIFDTSRAGIILVNAEGNIVLANQSMSDMFGYSVQELTSSSYLSLLTPDSFKLGEMNLIGLTRGYLEQVSCERSYRRKDGTDFHGYLSARRHNDPDGQLISIVFIITDITGQKRLEAERLELERQLLHSQKLESLGVLAGGIAHDFNNLLAVILGNLDLTLLRIPKTSPVVAGLERAVQACRKAADLTRQMLAYSGKGIVQLIQTDLNQLVSENIDLLRTTVPKNVSFNIDLADDLPRVTVDPSQIQQVIMNLITNASEAIGQETGAISLSTGIQECSDDFMALSRLEEKQAAGRYACIEVSDSGSGMDAETKQRIFDPFYSTKFVGRGLGMSAVLGIIKAHHGAIMLDSEPGQGSRFKVLLPVNSGAATDNDALEQRAAETATNASFTGTALVVDDDPFVREFCVHCVTLFGFNVLEASDGLEALEIFHKHSGAIKLVILDMSMPKMDGAAAFRELRSINPDIRVIICTGHSTQNTTLSFTEEKPDAYIQKPYSSEELRQTIEQLMQERPQCSSQVTKLNQPTP